MLQQYKSDKAIIEQCKNIEHKTASQPKNWQTAVVDAGRIKNIYSHPIVAL